MPAFQVNQRYRDTGSWRDPEDKFLRWIRGPLSAGIKNTGGIRDLSFEEENEPSALVLVSNDKGVSQHEDPWEDDLNVSAGYIEYWGDAKAGQPYDESEQNAKVKNAFERAAHGDRDDVPPVLVFRKPDSGVVQFCGLCIPDTVEVREYHDEDGVQIPNYLFHFTILNVQDVPVAWLHDRASDWDNSLAPDEWTEWVEEGIVSRWPLGDRIEDTTGHRRRVEREEMVVSGQFRDDTLARFGHSCVVTGIGETSVLDIAHVLSRSDRPDLAEDEKNVLVMNALHHRAFDADLFTINAERQLRVNPVFDPGHPFLRETIVEKAGENVVFPPEVTVQTDYLAEKNANLAWL